MIATAARAAMVDAQGRDTTEINNAIRDLLAAGAKQITVVNPGSKHNLAVAILEPTSPAARHHGFEPAPLEKYRLPPGGRVDDVTITFAGSVGYFCAGLIDGPTVVIQGRAGWSLAENMMNGTVICEKAAGSSTGSCLRGGTLVVKGDAGGRTGIQMKGGIIVVGGRSGFNTGFMMQQGRMIICGDVGPGVGDSMYDGEIFVGGKVARLGVDTKEVELSGAEAAELAALLGRFGLAAPEQWHKIVAGKKLYHYDKLEPLERKIAL